MVTSQFPQSYESRPQIFRKFTHTCTEIHIKGESETCALVIINQTVIVFPKRSAAQVHCVAARAADLFGASHLLDFARLLVH